MVSNKSTAHFACLSNEYALAIIVNEQTRQVCTPAAVCAPELLFERIIRRGGGTLHPHQHKRTTSGPRMHDL